MKFRLDDVTLIAVSSNKVKETIDAFQKSMQKIEFAASIIVSPNRVEATDGLKWEQSVVPINNYNDYNHYCIYNLHKHVKTSHALLIQWDGYVLNPHLWNHDFLEYDYIGAPWQIKDNAYIDPFGNHIRVGNGGFSLRSHKLMQLSESLKEDGTSIIEWNVNQGNFYKHFGYGAQNEDGIICVHNRHVYEKHGCKFAPVEVAVRFSQELRVPEAKGITPFGFHRYGI